MKRIKNIFKKSENNNTNQAVSIEEEVLLAKTGEGVISDDTGRANIRNFLFIGRSGNGKSTLANVITNTNNFKESEKGISETRIVQSEEFEEDGIKRLIIDTPGIGDTKLSTEKVLDIIAEAVYLVKDGVSQVFFVSKNRFDQDEMTTYDILRKIIFDEKITDYTTIVRTRFQDFRKSSKCEEDIDLMTKKNVSLARIVESCQRRVVHVDNPSVDVSDEDELKVSKYTRSKSRDKIMKHLRESCQKTYNPPKLKELNTEIFEYMEKKKNLKKELERLKNKETNNQNSKVESGSDTFVFLEENKTKLFVEKEEQKNEGEDNIGIVGIEEKIEQLQSDKERLEKEIEEKERIIRQKVLKHILNNYSEINEISSSDVFIDNIIGENNWQEISGEFIDKELILKWLSQGFDYEQVQKWATVLEESFNPKIDAGFVAWLRDDKKLTAERVKRSSYPFSIEQLRKEYADWLKKETEMLDKQNQQLDEEVKFNNWADVYPDFAKKNYWGKTYQQEWEQRGFTCQEAQVWIQAGFKLGDYNKVEQWREQNFDCQQATEWVRIGGLETKDAEFATYLKRKGYQPKSVLSLEQLRKEFSAWLEINRSAQEYLNYCYPSKGRERIKKLDVRYKNLTGSLDLSDFLGLEEIYCSHNLLTALKVDNCLKLKTLYCWDNQLTQLDLVNCEQLERLGCSDNYLQDCRFPSQLTELCIRNNNFSEQSLSMFRGLTNLEKLDISNDKQEKTQRNVFNRFTGSLKHLQGLVKLKHLDIGNIDVSHGLEYLPESVERFSCSTDLRKNIGCQTIYNLFANEEGIVETEWVGGPIKNFPQKLQTYKQKLQAESQVGEILETHQEVPPKQECRIM